jgi:hypothetical protein
MRGNGLGVNAKWWENSVDRDGETEMRLGEPEKREMGYETGMDRGSWW